MNRGDRLLLGTLRQINRWRFGLRLHHYAGARGGLAFLESGRGLAGPTLVFLHGLGASKDQWGPDIYAMGRRHHCLFIDLPGHGQSSCEPANGFGPQAVLGCLAEFLEQHGRRQLVLIGSSLGGCLAGMYAAGFASRVSHLVTLAPAGLGEDALGSAIKAGMDLGVPVFGYRTVEEMLNFWGLLFRRPPKVGRRLAQALAASGRERFVNVQRVVEDFRWEGLAQLLAHLPRIASSTLVIWGRHDRVFNVEALDMLLEQLPQGRGRIIADAGHLPYLEQGGEVVSAIEHFIALSPSEVL